MQEAAETESIEEIREAGAVPICECCLEPVPEDYSLFCPKCGAPIDPLASYLPFERILAQGYLFRQAAEHPTKLITVIGIWFIFLIPAALLGIAFLSMVISKSDDLGDLGMLDYLIFGSIFAVYLAISFRTTRGYFASRKERPQTEDVPSVEGPPG